MSETRVNPDALRLATVRRVTRPPTPPRADRGPVADRLQILHLVRHGQSTWNAQGRLQGQTWHVPLSDLGRAQSTAVARSLAGCGASALLTSDLVRARQSAEPIGRTLGLRPLVSRALREQGLDESTRSVHERVGTLLATLLDPPEAVVVLVSHGDTIRVAEAALRGLQPEAVPAVVPPNGSITTVRLVGGAVTGVRVHVPSPATTGLGERLDVPRPGRLRPWG